MNIATRSFCITSEDDPDQNRRIVQSIIECYQTAVRSMSMPMLRHVEKRVDQFDMQFILTFEPAMISADITDNSIIYTLI